MSARPSVVRGAILAYRVYDAGDMIALDQAERVLPDAIRLELGGPLVEGLVLAARPLQVPLGECTLAIAGLASGLAPLSAKASARIFDFGAVSILYEIPIAPDTELAALVPLCDALYDSPVLDARGAEHRAELSRKLGKSITRTHAWSEAESYTIVFIEELGGCKAADLVESETVAKLLLGEQSAKRLSEAARKEVLANAYSYLEDDLVIVDWNSAIVVEPSGSRVVPHVLELATSQLLEFRYYDGILDRELGQVYDEIERTPRVLRNPFSARTRLVLKRFMDLTEFTERVDNAIKSVGDFYLARVYSAAQRRFRVPDWRESVEAKLRLVERAYELLKGEVEVSRTQLLELTVVVLILVEIVAAFRH